MSSPADTGSVAGTPAIPSTPPLPAEFEAAAAALSVYVELLAGAGVTQGLIGPREVPRLWDRHVLNCAVVAELIPNGASVIDVGSGAGLPGLPLALVRPDLDIVLLEPLLRRATFLEAAVIELGLDSRVRVDRGRAEDRNGTYAADIVTARAVAPLARLATWCLPLANVGGAVLALKGAQAAAELAVAQPMLAGLGAGAADVLECGVGVVDPPTTVIRLPRVRRLDHSPRRKR